MATGAYDDAWETVGWTSQNPATIPEPSDPPVILPHVRLFGDYQGITGRDMHGVVKAVPSKRIAIHEGTTVFLPLIGEQIHRGEVDFEIPIGDWTWTITQRIGPITRTHEGIQPTVDLDLSTLL